MAILFSSTSGHFPRFAILLLFFLLGSPHAVQHAQATMKIDGSLDFVRPDGTPAVSISIEIADTPEARTLGLMGREVPDFTSGMLFIFERSHILNFWMRDTPAALDIIFVAESGEILNIAHSTTPMTDTIYSSAGTARFVVEVRGGFAEHFDIVRGTRIQWRRTD